MTGQRFCAPGLTREGTPNAPTPQVCHRCTHTGTPRNGHVLARGEGRSDHGPRRQDAGHWPEDAGRTTTGRRRKTARFVGGAAGVGASPPPPPLLLADTPPPGGLGGGGGETEAERRADGAHDYPEAAIAQAFRNVAAEARPGR